MKHAESHYNEGGWDVVVECYDKCDIVEIITEGGIPETEEEAIRRVGEVVGTYHDVRQDVWHAGGLDDNGRLPEEVCDTDGPCRKTSHHDCAHCTCRDYDDMCDFCSYKSWMEDMKDSGPVCEDGGYRWHNPDAKCDTGYRFYHTSCFLSQEALDSDIPF